MRWGRKKPSSSSSSRPSLISHVLPSWITKIKQVGVNSGQEHEETKPSAKWNSVPISSPCYANGGGGGGGGGKFYGGDGDAFWRLSFGEDAVDGEMNRRGTQSVLYNSDNEPEFPPSCCQSCRSNVAVDGQEDTVKFSDMVSVVRKTRGLPREVEVVPEIEMLRSQKVAEIRTPGPRIERDKNIKRRSRRTIKEKELDLHGKSSEADLGRAIKVIQGEGCELKASDRRRSRYMLSVNSGEPYFNKTEKECAFSYQEESGRASADNLNSEWQKLKEMKIEELKSKCVKPRKSVYISRELERKKPKQQSKVRAYSPRTATKIETCRIKALEDMKRAKLKMKKKAKENAIEGLTGLESFAMVKCSYDPQEDFRDSMMEMIKERRIKKPEELEELLACYLTLNSDEYHNLIIKVFRQVWFDLNQACFHTGLENDQCYYD